MMEGSDIIGHKIVGELLSVAALIEKMSIVVETKREPQAVSHVVDTTTKYGLYVMFAALMEHSQLKNNGM